MMDESAVTLLREVAVLRRRTRGDRQGYWLPLLLLGALILAAPLVYRGLVFSVLPTGASAAVGGGPAGPAWRVPGTNQVLTPLQLFAANSALVRDPTVVALYWLGVVVIGLVATVAWYRWRGLRVGVETSTRTFILVGAAGLLFLLGVIPLIIGTTAGSLVRYPSAALFSVVGVAFALSAGGAALALRRPAAGRRPAWRFVCGVIGIAVALASANVVLFFAAFQGYAPLLVIAVALLALAAVERSRLLAVVAILFTAAAVLVNLYNLENMAYRLGLPYTDDARFVAFTRVLLPAAVLIVGGIIGAAAARQTTR